MAILHGELLGVVAIGINSTRRAAVLARLGRTVLLCPLRFGDRDESLQGFVARLEDPRKGNARWYDLLLQMPRLGTASSGAEDCHDMAKFAQAELGRRLAGFGFAGAGSAPAAAFHEHDA